MHALSITITKQGEVRISFIIFVNRELANATQNP
jgi:hypothetical protein